MNSYRQLPSTVTLTVASAEPEAFLSTTLYGPLSARLASLTTSNAWSGVVCSKQHIKQN